jgi:hypothetical protein
MGRFEAIYEKIPELIKDETSRIGYRKNKKTIIIASPEVNNRIKFKYTGFCQKQGDTIIKMYPDADSLGKLKTGVLKIIKQPLNKRKFNGYEWFKTCEL